MSDTKIEWATKVWNPLRGCSKVSEGCRNCYAIRVAHRFGGVGMPYEGLTQVGTGGPNWTGKIKLAPDMLNHPLDWKKPQRVFVNSMSDLFHPEVPFEFIEEVFETMALAKQHTFQILTKRPGRMLDFFKRCVYNVHFPGNDPLRNVWVGVSVEDQKAADERIPLLLQAPAAVRFLSCEPLLGQLDLTRIHSGPNEETIDWMIVGGESGPGARPMHPDWTRSLRDQCTSAGVPFFFKQWGEWLPVHSDRPSWSYSSPESKCQTIDGTRFYRIGKKAAGRLLDGRTWDEFPKKVGS